jgi:HAD superfamily hydrolase (TIGR01459 family)
MPHLLDNLSEIAPDYDVMLCDVWGVIHNGLEAFPVACAALEQWMRQRGPVILISNSPRPREGVLDQLNALGVPRDAWSDIVTSGDVTRTLLSARIPGPAWRIGPDRDAPLYEGLGLQFSDLEEAAFIACTGPFDDEVETPEDYRVVLAKGAARGLDMICANPDLMVQRGERLVYCGGALAALYETLGGRVMMAGKPFAPIYELSLARAEAQLSGVFNRRRVLAIGDGLATDVAGARAQALDMLFIAAGVHAADASDSSGRLDMKAVAATLTTAGGAPRYAMQRLVW